MQERLQKFLANSGLGSRRYCESLIKEGKILVNGKVAELGSKVGLSDEIFYEGKVISRTKSDLKVILLNKPEGVLSSNLKEKNRSIVFDFLPENEGREWIQVSGFRDTPGRPALYKTTKKFLDDLNLKNISMLPKLPEVIQEKDLYSEVV